MGLQHEFHLRGNDGDRSLKIVWPRVHILEMAMQQYTKKYNHINEALRKTADKDPKVKFMGHTHGKKTVAKFRNLIVRLSAFFKSSNCPPLSKVTDNARMDHDEIMEAIAVIHARAAAYTKDPHAVEVTSCYGIHAA
eukprot:gnl/MRDRNA2_/MRDRNA2_134910_c0_seq1.p1 gnl/MRDRNA2_/MRDRNA2_134910_c0~~gnl/MRDRNA2_/MRDRNA2_134910_c0_seq1.p1  ORF type:complete len:137 (-),score=29.27 gnl/MRDRNA2_/MRDRNA2_134910_c0_seq1:474-884(-)